MSAPSSGGKRKGAWLAHVKKTMKAESGLKKSMGKKWFTHVLKSAKKSYHKKGGADSSSDDEPTPPKSGPSAPAGVAHMEGEPTAPGGRRRGRKGGKTRRHRK
jgi:hypothetical protein